MLRTMKCVIAALLTTGEMPTGAGVGVSYDDGYV